MKKLPREQLILKAVLLLRTVNKNESKEEQLKMMAQYYSIEQLEDYIEHFYDPDPISESSYDEYYTDEDEYYLKVRRAAQLYYWITGLRQKIIP